MCYISLNSIVKIEASDIKCFLLEEARESSDDQVLPSLRLTKQEALLVFSPPTLAYIS